MKALVLMLATAATVASAQKPRVVVTTDPELDDANSLIRYLLYSTDFRTEGLIYASSQFHWKGDGTGKKLSVPNREYSRWGLNLCPCASWRWAPDEHYIDIAVATYARVYPNLRVHNSNYPSPAEVQSKIRWGNVAFDGDISQDTPGSVLSKRYCWTTSRAPFTCSRGVDRARLRARSSRFSCSTRGRKSGQPFIRKDRKSVV